MKKIFIIAAIFALAFAGRAHATEYNYKTSTYSVRVLVTGSYGYIYFTNNSTKAISDTVTVCKKEVAAASKCGASDIFFQKNTGTVSPDQTLTLTLPSLPTDSVVTYYVQLNSSNSFKFYSDKYVISINTPTDAKSTERTVTVAAPATDRRNLYILINSESIASTKKYLNQPKYVGDLDNNGGAQVKIVIPGTNADQTYYVMLASADNATNPPTMVPIGNELVVQAKGTTNWIEANPLKFTLSGNDSQVVGQINAAKVPNPENYVAFLEYRPATTGKPYTADINDPDLVSKSAAGLRSRTTTDISKGFEGINHDGSYYWTLNNIGVGNYWYRETFWNKDFTKIVDTPVVGEFNGKGLVIQNSTDQQADFEHRSYRLLAPLPGLSVLLDPDLCQEQQNANPGKGQICSISDFLNYVFKLLIGVAAVILVLRLIFEGFKYATTAVPFLKIDAKAKFGQAFGGLLLALAAWLILNTLNPQLVSNTISIPTVVLQLHEPGDDGIGIEIQNGQTVSSQKLYLKTTSGEATEVTACDSTQMATVTAFGTTFQIQKQLVPSIQRIDAKWRQLNPAYKIPMTVEDTKAMGGYNCRTIANRKILSYHAYGLAVDINPIENPMGKTLKTDMPDAFVQLWKNEGWGWGGEWKGTKDAMHFSKGINEGGDMVIR